MEPGIQGCGKGYLFQSQLLKLCFCLPWSCRTDLSTVKSFQTHNDQHVTQNQMHNKAKMILATVLHVVYTILAALLLNTHVQFVPCHHATHPTSAAQRPQLIRKHCCWTAGVLLCTRSSCAYRQKTKMFVIVSYHPQHTTILELNCVWMPSFKKNLLFEMLSWVSF